MVPALALAEPEGYVRKFLDGGPPLRKLLKQLLQGQQKGAVAKYGSKLLAEWAREAKLQQAMPGLVEPLTSREMEVLRLLAAGLSNQEIAQELFLAVGTVKKYSSNIYGKLGVRNRTRATARARELELL